VIRTRESAHYNRAAEKLSFPGGSLARTGGGFRTRSAMRIASRAGWSASRCSCQSCWS